MNNCTGFIDGTGIRIARPVRGQRACYSGHKRAHMLKYQSVVAPDGLFLHIWGPLEGRRHDMTTFRASKIEDTLASCMNVDNQQYCIYGDPAYVLRPYLQIGYTGANLTEGQMLYNASMSAVRECVEWGFKDLKQIFTINDFARGLKVFRTPVALLTHASAGIHNIRCCLYGSQTSRYLNCRPPAVEDLVSLLTN